MDHQGRISHSFGSIVLLHLAVQIGFVVVVGRHGSKIGCIRMVKGAVEESRSGKILLFPFNALKLLYAIAMGRRAPVSRASRNCSRLNSGNYRGLFAARVS